MKNSNIKISLRMKLLISFSLVIVFIIVMGSMTMYLQNDSRRILTQVIDNELRLHTIQSLDYSVSSSDDEGAWYIMTGGDSSYEANYQNDVKAVSQLYSTLQNMTSDTHNRQRMIIFHQQWLNYLKGNQLAFSMITNKMLTGNMQATAELMYISVPFTKVIQPLIGYTNYLKSDETMLINQLNGENSLSQIILVIDMIVVLFLSVAVALVISRQIGRAVQQVQQAMRKLGEKDLRIAPLRKITNDELGELVLNVNDTVLALRQIITKLLQSSEGISSAADETAASTEQTTAALVEVASQMQQLSEEAQSGQEATGEVSKTLMKLSSLIQQAQYRADSAIDQAQNTKQAAETGRQTVNRTVIHIRSIQDHSKATEEKMNELQFYSKEIETIAETIRNIAEQTNLLALNASIEAARAGEQGAGFAVVAEEVRKLAEQAHQESGRVSAVLTRVSQVVQTSVQMTRDTITAVEEGVKQATSAGEALLMIEGAVQSTVEDIEEIHQMTQDEVASSDKMVDLIAIVSKIIENTTNHAQSVATSSEEMSAAMETIASGGQLSIQQAVELSELVAQFKLPSM